MMNGSASSTWGICSLVGLLGCATAQPATPENSLVLPPKEDSLPPQAPPAAPLRKPGEATSIVGPDALVGLCQTLRDETATDFPGNPVEQARASAAHAERRQAAETASYVTVVPASGFSFRSYQIGEHRLLLDTDRSFVLGDGAELFASSKDAPPGFSLAPDFAERVLGDRASGRLGLQLVFRPARSELRKDACMWLSGGHVVKLGIDVVAAALLGPDGGVVARGDTGDYGAPNGGLPVRSPAVTARRPRGPDGKDVPDAIAELFSPLSRAAQPCYQRVLLVRPALRGTVVLAIRLAASGKVDEARVEMSSLGDDAVTACVVASARSTTLPGIAAGQRYSVPLQFASADER
jgi:hypothetical protein